MAKPWCCPHTTEWTRGSEPESRRTPKTGKLGALRTICPSAAVSLAGNKPRQFIQFAVHFSSTAAAGGWLHYLQFEVSDPPVASQALAEIVPVQVAAGAVTQFTYKILPRLTGTDLGFDSIEIETPARVASIDQVRLEGVPGGFHRGSSGRRRIRIANSSHEPAAHQRIAGSGFPSRSLPVRHRVRGTDFRQRATPRSASRSNRRRCRSTGRQQYF